MQSPTKWALPLSVGGKVDSLKEVNRFSLRIETVILVEGDYDWLQDHECILTIFWIDFFRVRKETKEYAMHRNSCSLTLLLLCAIYFFSRKSRNATTENNSFAPIYTSKARQRTINYNAEKFFCFSSSSSFPQKNCGLICVAHCRSYLIRPSVCFLFVYALVYMFL